MLPSFSAILLLCILPQVRKENLFHSYLQLFHPVLERDITLLLNEAKTHFAHAVWPWYSNATDSCLNTIAIRVGEAKMSPETLLILESILQTAFFFLYWKIISLRALTFCRMFHGLQRTIARAPTARRTTDIIGVFDHWVPLSLSPNTKYIRCSSYKRRKR